MFLSGSDKKRLLEAWHGVYIAETDMKWDLLNLIHFSHSLKIMIVVNRGCRTNRINLGRHFPAVSDSVSTKI